MNKENNKNKGHVSLLLDEIPKYEPIHPTYEEIERTLPSFKDQHVPQIMTPEILEEVIPYVQKI